MNFVKFWRKSKFLRLILEKLRKNQENDKEKIFVENVGKLRSNFRKPFQVKGG